GSSWNFADLGLAKDVAYDWDFHAVHGSGKQYWVVGRPGSVVLHSADDGAHWEVQRTGQPLPLDGVTFADEEHGWAVGELGSIIATSDGGKTWKLQRRGGQRAAAMFVHARAAGTPLDAIAVVGGQDGYLTASLRVTGADPAGAAPARAADAMRFAAAVRQAGGAAAESLWQFPVPSYLAHSGRDDLLPAWDQRHAGRAAEQLLRQAVLALRVWRPDVVVTDGPPSPLSPGGRGVGGDGGADGLGAEAMREALKAIRRRAELTAICEPPIGGLTEPDKLLSRVGPMLADMPDDQAGRAAFAVASRFARAGQWDMAREAFLLLVDRYPAHPRTP